MDSDNLNNLNQAKKLNYYEPKWVKKRDKQVVKVMKYENKYNVLAEIKEHDEILKNTEL